MKIRLPAKTKVGIFAVDPGTTTGVAYNDTPLVTGLPPKDAFAQAGLTVEQVDCNDEREGTSEIVGLWEVLTQGWKIQGVQQQHMFFVIEDFILRPGPHSSARSGLSPVRMTARIQGQLDRARQPVYIFQTPADAKATWTNERLRRADLWTKGMEHGRDATRHMALFYKRHLTA